MIWLFAGAAFLDTTPRGALQSFAFNFSAVSAFVIGRFGKKRESISDNGFYLKIPY